MYDDYYYMKRLLNKLDDITIKLIELRETLILINAILTIICTALFVLIILIIKGANV